LLTVVKTNVGQIYFFNNSRTFQVLKKKIRIKEPPSFMKAIIWKKNSQKIENYNYISNPGISIFDNFG
jgi:hypothetical protein